MSESKFYYCNEHKTMALLLSEEAAQLLCEGVAMKKLTANTSDGAAEKHVPVVKKEQSTINVCVGDVHHPMEAAHSIEWIYLETKNGGQWKHLHPGEPPVADFAIKDDEPVCVYAYCNLHGLWKTML